MIIDHILFFFSLSSKHYSGEQGWNQEKNISTPYFRSCSVFVRYAVFCFFFFKKMFSFLTDAFRLWTCLFVNSSLVIFLCVSSLVQLIDWCKYSEAEKLKSFRKSWYCKTDTVLTSISFFLSERQQVCQVWNLTWSSLN